MKNQTADIFLGQNSPGLSNEEALSLILNNLEDAFLLIDKQLRIITLSEHTKLKIKEYFGVQVSAGMSVLKIASEERQPSLINLYEEVFKGKVLKSETEVNSKEGIRFFENIFKPARNEAGEIIGAIVLSRDITEAKRSEIFLKETEERWRFALEGAKQGVWDWNIQTGDVFFSSSCKRIYGFGDDEMKNRIEEWESRIHPDDKDKIDMAVRDHVSSPNPFYETTYRFKTKDGTYKWLLARGLVMSQDQEGKPLRMIGTHTDITDQVNTAEELRISNDRYRHAILATSDIVWDWDLITNQIYWSDNFTRVMGWRLPSDKLLAIDFCMEHFHPADKGRVGTSLSAVVNDPRRTNWQEEFRYLKADGNYAHVSDRGYVIRDADGAALRMIGAMQDISERKQNEQILSLEKLVFEMSANLQNSFFGIVTTLLEGIEKIYADCYSSVLRLKDDGSVEHLASHRLPAEFCGSVNGLKIGPKTGSCGTAMYLKQTVIVEDIESDPLWENHRELPARHGLRACWSLPIIHSSGKVMGSFAIYYKQAKSPTYNELNTLERIRNIMRVLMEHNWSLNEIRMANERFDIMMRATHDLIWDWDLETNIIYRDEIGLKKVYGLNSNEPIRGIYQWLGHIHPEDQSRAEELINDILQATNEETFDLEYRFRRDDGTYSHVYDRAMIIRNAEGKPIRMIGAAQDVTERKRLEQELLQNELDRQKAINQATVDTQEQERSEIGKELHDNVNQVLTTTKLYLDLAQTNTELKDDLIAKSNKNIVSVINEIRQLSRSLMDPSIGDLGLIDSMHDLIESINLTRKLKVDLIADKKMEALLDKNQKLTVFRIIQEALNNAIKHAKATVVTISIKANKKMISILIADNGIGFEPAYVKKGAGLKNIQNRIYLINGSHAIQSAPGKGCKIKINFPINKQNH